MKVDFKNIVNHIISMEHFPLKWRFTDESYNKIPDEHLNQLRPLDIEAAKYLWGYISKADLHRDVPFKRGFFRTIEKVEILGGNEEEVRKWLYQRVLPFDKDVYLSWQPTEAMIVPYKILIRYFDSFYYGSSDDLTVIDPSLAWALLFYHEDEIYFGTKKTLSPAKHSLKRTSFGRTPVSHYRSDCYFVQRFH